MDTSGLLTADQVAEILGVRRRSVYHFARYLDGFPPPAGRIGRTPLWGREAIEAWRTNHPARQRTDDTHL